MTRLCHAVLCAAGLLFSSASFAESCSEAAPAPPVVKPSFKLTVLDSGHAPSPGVRVTLGTVDRYNAIHPISNGNTDKDGVLFFVGIKPGSYSFRFTDGTGERQWFPIQVASDGQDTATYTWHYTKWIALPVASGVLMHDDEPMRHYHVMLEGYPDGYTMGTSDTDLDGRFDLPASRPGKYYFEIADTNHSTGEARPLGRIPVNIALSDGPDVSEPIFINQNACGITYDQFCTLPPVKLATSCIQAVSPTGVAIGKARASLRAQDGSATTRLRANDAGVIPFPNLAAGDYELQIFAAGYTPIRRTLTVSAGAGACTSMSVVTMNPFGQGCAPVPGKAN